MTHVKDAYGNPQPLAEALRKRVEGDPEALENAVANLGALLHERLHVGLDELSTIFNAWPLEEIE